MKSHDLGQFIFNRSILSEIQIREMIKAAKKSQPSLAVVALFLQLIEATELTHEDDEFVRTLITPRQVARAIELKDGQSISFAQALIDSGVTNFLKLGYILEGYHNLEIPPVESALATYYEKLKNYPDIDFPFAVDVVRSFHSFLSETFQSTLVILPPSSVKNINLIGASVKIIGKVPVVVALLADEELFLKIAKKYDSYVDVIEDAHDAISELLNVFTGQLVVQIAVKKGLEEVPEPPRYGLISSDIEMIEVMSEFGNFQIYIGKQEIFD